MLYSIRRLPGRGSPPRWVRPLIMAFSDPNHPVWSLARIALVSATLLLLQLLTATNYDLALDGEAGTLAGTALTVSLLEFLKRPSSR